MNLAIKEEEQQDRIELDRSDYTYQSSLDQSEEEYIYDNDENEDDQHRMKAN